MNYKYDKNRPAEDSTKGKARCIPKTYKRDVLMQVWLESRHLATLLKWLESEGVFVRFRSEIVLHTVEQVVRHLTDSGVVEMIEFTDDAQRMLNSRFGVDSNPSGRGLANLHHNQVLDDRRKEMQIDRDAGTVVNHSGNTSTDDISRTVEEAVRIYKEQEKERMKKSAKETMQRIKATGGFDENGVSIPVSGKCSGIVYEEDMIAYREREKKREEQEELERQARILERRKKKILRKMEVDDGGARTGKTDGKRDETERDETS